jgi:hypothetical protein
MNTIKFITKAKTIHHNKYNYEKTNYINAKTKVEIICSIHGSFFQIPRFHVRKTQPTSCPHCNGGIPRSQEYFIKKSIIVHNNKYDYSKVQYINWKTKVCIICPEHGEFDQQPNNHMFGQGCPHCKSSQGERKIQMWLNNNNINYICQKTFNNCKGKRRTLPFDFYLPEYNICIEFQGEQHFRPAFGIKSFKNIQQTDYIKEQYCLQNNIKLLKINWDQEKNINQFLYSLTKNES